MSMFAVPNWTSHRAFQVEPWSFEPDIPDEVKQNKAQFSVWCKTPSVEHCFFSGVEGIDPLLRASRANPPAFLHALVVDYDSSIEKSLWESLPDRVAPELLPNWISSTFSSGVRLVWTFEEPLGISDPVILKAFLKYVQAELCLIKLFPGFDEPAFQDPLKYYECGTDWKCLKEEPLPSNVLHLWMYEAGKKVRWVPDIEIPMKDLEAELHDKYPGAWEGSFEIGARGRSFWSDTSTNPTSAIVRESGIQSFSAFPSFKSWEDLFGRAFVQKYQAERTGQIIADTLYDGMNYWRQQEDGSWIQHSREDFRLLLKARYGLSSSTTKGQTCSEVDRVMVEIHEQKRVEAALPFIHFPKGVLTLRGKKYLNTATAEPLKPANRAVDNWGDGFPWVADYLMNFFSSDQQLDFFLAWLKRFYEGAHFQQPALGQAVFIVGEVGFGKTLLSTGLIAKMVGGYADASSYLLKEERFTSHIVSEPLMTVDDTAPASNSTQHTQYSAMIKKITANRHQLFEKKFSQAGQVLWKGRIVVTCNPDPESIKLLPNMDINLMEKVSLFRCSTRKMEFPSDETVEALLNEELPYFCRYLLQWDVPAECIGDSRFGVKSFHDPILYQQAIQSGSSHTFLEILKTFLENYKFSSEETRTVWEGTSTKLLSDMLADESLRVIVGKYSPIAVATMLGQLKTRGYDFQRKRDKNRNRLWVIPFDIQEPEQ